MAQIKKSSEDDEPDITPMIDMTFLLLIFFMVTSTMKPEGALQIPSARNGIGVSADEAVVLSIFDDDGTPGVYLADGKKENGPAGMPEVTRMCSPPGKSTSSSKPTVKSHQASWRKSPVPRPMRKAETTCSFSSPFRTRSNSSFTKASDRRSRLFEHRSPCRSSSAVTNAVRS